MPSKKRKGQFSTCGRCGANLDPGEKCDCLETGESPMVVDIVSCDGSMRDTSSLDWYDLLDIDTPIDVDKTVEKIMGDIKLTKFKEENKEDNTR